MTIATPGISTTTSTTSKRQRRRHLNPGQRAVAALSVEKHLAVEAKKRQQEHGGTAPGRPATLTADRRFPENGTAAAQAARLTGASPRYVERAKQVAKR